MKKISCLAACLCMLIGMAACSKDEETPVVPPTQEPSVEDVIVEGDFPIVPTGGKASECQPGQDIGNSSAPKENPTIPFGTNRQPFPLLWNISLTKSQTLITSSITQEAETVILEKLIFIRLPKANPNIS